MERMHHYWGFMSIHSSKYGKDASLLGLHVHMSIHPVSMERMHHYWGFMSKPPVSLERMHHYWSFMSIHSSKYGKEASLLGLHIHTLQYVWKGCITTGASCLYTPVSMERMHHYWGFMYTTIHCSKYGKDASLLRLHVIHPSKYRKDASLLGLHVIHSSKYGKDASLLELHVHTLQ